VAITGSAASFETGNRRRPKRANDDSACAPAAEAVSGSGDVVKVTERPSSSSTVVSVEMAAVDHQRPKLEHELTYSDMETPKGLRNSRGENNCFLNSAVQVSVCLFARQNLCTAASNPRGKLGLPCYVL